MNIKDIKGISGVGSRQPVANDNRRPEPSDAKPKTDATGTTDQLTLTAAGRYLANVEEHGEAAPVDKPKVEALRAALADGSYQVDARRVAAKLIRTDQELV